MVSPLTSNRRPLIIAPTGLRPPPSRIEIAIDKPLTAPVTEKFSNAPSRENALSLLELGGRSFLHSAVQQPLDGFTQLVNHVAGKEILPDPQLISAPAPAAFGTKSWYAQTIGSGFGMVVPFLAVEGVSNAALARAGSLAERTAAGSSLLRTLNMSAAEAADAGGLVNAVRFAAPALKMGLNGALYGAVLTPSTDPEQGFWQQRGVAAASSALTFGAMGLASRGLMAGAESTLNVSMSDQLLQSTVKGAGIRIGANAIGGAVGGAVSAETNSVFSGKGFASGDQVMQSIASFMVTGAALDGAHLIGDHVQAARQLARRDAPPDLSPADQVLLDKVQRSHFEYFRQQSDPLTGLTKDRSTDQSPASIAAVGFSLTAHGVAADRGWLTRDEAADYTLKVLKNLSSTPQGEQASGTSGQHGFFYHFLDPKTGTRSGENEVSTIDTALLMAGVLYSKNYFDGNSPKESQIRDISDKLYRRVDWNWAMNSDGRLSMGWTPESGFIKSDWQGYNEAQILLMLGMGSPTHPLPASAWEKYTSTYKVSELYGEKSIEFGPLFGHQYSQVWLDLRGKMDAVNQKLGFDYFENSRRATLAQQKYAIENPQNWSGYGALDWGLTASDGPGDVSKVVDGRTVQFHSYSARGFPNSLDDGTIASTAAAGSLPFAPEVVMPTLKHWVNDRPEIMGPLGFRDAFNPTFDKTKSSGWVDKETLGIDQGPIMLMTENYRNRSVWRTMRGDPYLNSALNKAGFATQLNRSSGH